MADELLTQYRKRRWLQRRDVRFILVVAVVVAIFTGQGYVLGPARITDSLKSALAEKPKKLNINVTARFPAEQFHMAIYQDVGSIRGSDGSTTTIFRVSPSDIRLLSRKYWIKSVDLAPATN